MDSQICRFGASRAERGDADCVFSAHAETIPKYSRLPRGMIRRPNRT
ncbi:hypothetical protein [Slackia isoflavoniconvertens]